uniref:Reverse transcriptase Ty1/copia-type domain-containing protein n=1 Tax=Tanacetum cinerariifolium TaxID=118510 RepID=A0A699HI07_TANCI|nr:hypothetical protein [Tanacetum cinerariifolium]
MQMTKKLLSGNFDMKYLGEADVILGIKILRKENRLILTQSHYIEKILKSFDCFNCLPVSTPFEVASKLTYNTSKILAQNKYAKVIGSLIGDPSVLEGYIDASWITDQEDYASTSEWIFTLEFVALASCCKEAEWLRDLLINIPLWPKAMSPISVHCDSQSTLSRAYNQVYGNILDNVHLSECGSEVASYELKGLALKHSKKRRYRLKARLNASAQSGLNEREEGYA